ncbi:hypothetical protein [Reyranella sp.]|uniref:hypothetical protein n=1 Tax=Reyranella sp. TaxID=1929291 RepID=UPI003BADB086
MPYSLQNSTYLDLDSYFNNGLSNGGMPTGSTPAPPTYAMNVALVLDRASPEETLQSLLGGNWASRQKALAELGPGGVDSAFGADPQAYQTVLNDLAGMGLQTTEQTVFPGLSGYVSSAASRTIWVQLDTAGFQTLFGTPLLKQDGEPSGKYYWNGNLTIPDAWAGIVKGLWFDVDDSTFGAMMPSSGGSQGTLTPGYQGIGNGAAAPGHSLPPTDPQTVASYYNFPLLGQSVATGAIGLLESGLGDLSPVPGMTVAQLLDQYREGILLPGGAMVIGVEPGGFNGTSTAERSLDMGVATAINPNSPLILYAGSGSNGSANSEPFTAYQAAIWDTVNNPAVVSSSERFVVAQPSPGSPFLWAAQQLFVDAALRNITVVSSSGDGGSGYEIANGFTNVTYTRSSPYGLVVGGTSLSLGEQAAVDPTLAANLYALAVDQHDPATLWSLVGGGLTAMPTADDPRWFIETVWNRYYLTQPAPYDLQPGYQSDESGNGGVDPTQSTPWFQSALSPFVPFETADGTNLAGRGVPDVSALAGGNMLYNVPPADLIGTSADGGTSASTPLWASLIVQFNAIFNDQGLPNLGYMTDLLYIAAAIAPASFNDVTQGNNVSSFLYGGATYQSEGEAIIPTVFGYTATVGYDLASGLGSPNGTLLGRALTAIAHSQMYYEGSVAGVIDSDGNGGWSSGAAQSLLLQGISYGQSVDIDFLAGGGSASFDSLATSAFAWTPRFAGQVMQSFFDPQLVILFDKQAQGTVGQVTVGAGQALSVTLDGEAASAFGMALTSSFGFADFQASATSALHVARPVAIAEIPDGAGTMDAIVRLRQAGTDSLAVSFYRVDDLAGHIGGLSPGDAGYAAAAQNRAYQVGSGGTQLAGPGYGNFAQSTVLNVGAGDVIAMTLIDQSTGATYWGFARGNETVNGQSVAHLWNYGLNTWGFEDQYGGGDHDFNDLLIQLDFTSGAGHGWLA